MKIRPININKITKPIKPLLTKKPPNRLTEKYLQPVLSYNKQNIMDDTLAQEMDLLIFERPKITFVELDDKKPFAILFPESGDNLLEANAELKIKQLILKEIEKNPILITTDNELKKRGSSLLDAILIQLKNK